MAMKPRAMKRKTAGMKRGGAAAPKKMMRGGAMKPVGMKRGGMAKKKK